jgi:deoxynucleoside triphosphate triphosphohydrolase SAMHD1
LDYIVRDSFQLGIARGINIPRLIKSCRVIDGELAWSSNDQDEVLKVFKRRWELHNKCTLFHGITWCDSFQGAALDYSDETAATLNHMFGDALLAANGHLGLSSRVDDPGRYVHLTDTILHQIRQSTNEVGPYGCTVGLWSLCTDVIMYRNL